MCSTLHRISIALAALLFIVSASNAHAVGSPDTRLIALGINEAILSPFTPARMFEIDKQTGEAMPLGAEFVFEANPIGYHLAANSSGQLFSARGGALARINQLNLDGTAANFVPVSDGTQHGPFVLGIDFDSQDRLHGVLLNGAPNVDAVPYLAEIDLATGVVTGGPGVGGGQANIAFDAQDDLYAASVQGLIQINSTNGQITPIGGDLWTSGGRAIAFDSDGTLLAVGHQLVVVNLATGNTTPVGAADFGVYSMVGLAVVQIPEPGAAGFFGFTFVLLRRSKRASSTAAERRLS
jgi:hypothetical protein